MLTSCKAQVVPYGEENDLFEENSGEYYKDVANHFNPFEGTWKSIQGALEWTIVLRKEEAIDDNEGYTYDLLIGEYRYVNNGLEVANTLDNINNPNLKGYDHLIGGFLSLTKYNRPTCPECNENEIRMSVSVRHPEYELISADLILRKVTVNGQERLEARLLGGYNLSNDPNAPDTIPIPYGEYTFVKQF